MGAAVADNLCFVNLGDDNGIFGYCNRPAFRILVQLSYGLRSMDTVTLRN